MTQNENIHFETFKNDFYSRIDDFSIFDFGKYNALKIVLDGLKVNYVARFKSRATMFYPLWMVNLMFAIKRRKHENDRKISNHTTKKTILLVDYSGRYGTSEDGREVSFYFDKIITEIGHEFLHHISYHRQSKAIQYDWVCDDSLFLEYTRISKAMKALRTSLLTLYGTIKKQGIFNTEELENIRIALTSFFKKVNYWNEVLDQMPHLKTAIIEMHYHNEALIYCLKERNIHIMEIQHGLISVKDIFYVFPEKTRAISGRALFPDGIFVYGQYWKDVLLKGEEYGHDPGRITVLGNYVTDTPVIDAREKEALDGFTGQAKIILFTTQTLMHDDFIPYIQWLSEDIAKRGLNYKIIVKTHPSENIGSYDALKDLDNVLVTWSNLYYLFSIAQIHVSIYSTTLYDALHYGLHNFSLSCSYAEDYRSEILEAGIALPLSPRENPVDSISNGNQGVKINSRFYFDEFQINKINLTAHLPKKLLNDYPEKQIMSQDQHLSPRQCRHCVLDTSDDPAITFDEHGVCNHCNTFKKDYSGYMGMSDAEKKSELDAWIKRIKADGKGKKYDVVCGVSGGVDSSYLAARAKEMGLNALLVHFDNGWNSELAVKNIEQICHYTGFDLYTYVVNWEEFKDLQLAYIRAGVLDWEVPTDHGLWAVVLKKAKELDVKYVLIGANYQTEGILPKAMRYDKGDLKNIRDIYRKFGKKKRFKTFPTYPFWWNQYLIWVWGLKRVPFLYYMEYNKAKSKEYLVNTVGWRDYGGKHYESIFTRFYQGYVLKEKFGYDKRKAHMASLICSGQITKEEALKELSKPMIEPDVLEHDLSFFLKKMNLSKEEFNRIMHEKPVPHENFKSYSTFEYPLFKKLLAFLVKIKQLTKK